ncbi:MAG TPA: hypothetical protein VK465_05690 [Fibrobacteria bacterium]|nr:hypothetical protein [Fibrobacteria bacterium]
MIDSAPEAAVWLGLGLPSLGLLFKIIPQRGAQEKGVLKEVDLERLDERVKLYERLKGVEDRQEHGSDLLERLMTDFKDTSGTLFTKIDNLTRIILERKETPHA